MKIAPYSEQRQIFFELLREARKSFKLTQTELATHIGWSQSDISKVERGVRKLDVVELRLWLRGLGTSLEAFAVELNRRLNAKESLQVKLSLRDRTIKRKAHRRVRK